MENKTAIDKLAKFVLPAELERAMDDVMDDYRSVLPQNLDRDGLRKILQILMSKGYSIKRNEGRNLRTHFISYSTEDNAKVARLRSFMEANSLRTWFAPSNINEMGEWENQIREGLQQSQVFIVLLSEESIKSEWVLREITLALNDYGDRFNVNDPTRSSAIIPVFLDEETEKHKKGIFSKNYQFDFADKKLQELAKESYSKLGKFQSFSLSSLGGSDAIFQLQLNRFLEALGVKDLASVTQYGSLALPLKVYVGGDGITRYQRKSPEEPQDILTTFTDSYYERPTEILTAEEIINDIKRKRTIFINNPNVRFVDAGWGSENYENLPLKMDFEWTWYYDVHVTNFAVDKIANNETGVTVGELLYSPMDEITSRYADPFATNLSVVTSDGYIIISKRSPLVAGNANTRIQPAVSGTGSGKDFRDVTDENGNVISTYDPFKTAVREAREEIIGNAVKEEDFELVFFGLARRSKFRFPFLFGEIRLNTLTSNDLINLYPETHWENRGLIPIKFEIDELTDWIRNNYQEYPLTIHATTYFSLIQSLIYKYPDRITEIMKKLTF